MHFRYVEKLIFHNIVDSDSSLFSKNANTGEPNNDFPADYIKHIKDNIGKVDIIFVSTHKTVRNALKEAGITYSVIAPYFHCFSEWLRRYDVRENNCFTRQTLIDNWFLWVSQCYEEQYSGVKVVNLDKGQYLSDIIDEKGNFLC